jgi:uncharacterized membrane protein HdeD (DUF308 family)
VLVLGGLILAQWPASGLWVIGLFVGIDLIFAMASPGSLLRVAYEGVNGQSNRRSLARKTPC